jgi:hypothetical protein
LADFLPAGVVNALRGNTNYLTVDGLGTLLEKNSNPNMQIGERDTQNGYTGATTALVVRP